MKATSDKKLFVVGTRESTLARLQTEAVLKALSAKFPNLQFQTVPVKTIGDKILNKPLADLGGRGVFVKELEEALFDNRVDFVVHSLKDLPTTVPDGLCLASVLEREDTRDVLVSCNNTTFLDLPPGSRVATSSRRRAAQLSALRRDLNFVDIRGNIPTRLRKHEEGACDAMVLAAAGLIRLELDERIAEFFDQNLVTPAAGQGALAIECRSEDKTLIEILQAINDPKVWSAITAERAFLSRLGGGCSLPIGAYARINDNGQLELTGCVASLDGKQVFRKTVSGNAAQAARLADSLAEALIAAGAAEIINHLISLPAGSVSPP